MSVYYDYPLDLTYRAEHVILAGHERYALLAVASEGKSRDGEALCTVQVFTEEGERIARGCLQRSTAAVCIKWHPVQRLLAAAWKGGSITIYNNETDAVFETGLFHTSGVVIFLFWNMVASHLVSGDEFGEVAIWNIDQEGRPALGEGEGPQVVHYFDKLTAAALRPMADIPSSKVEKDFAANLARRAISGDEAALDLFLMQQRVSAFPVTSTALTAKAELQRLQLEAKSIVPSGRSHFPLMVYVGTPDGGIYYVTVDNNSKRVAELDSGVHTLLFSEQTSMLLALTERQDLCRFAVNADGSLEQVISLKLACPRFPAGLRWTMPGVLAFTSHEKSVRMWDLNNDEGYMLTPAKGTGRGIVKCLAFNGHHANTRGVIVAGSDQGYMLQWWHSGIPKRTAGTDASADAPEDETDSSQAWEALDPTHLETPINQIVCMGTRQIFAYEHKDGVTVLKQGNMSSCYAGQICAVQVGSSRVIVENLQKNEVRELRTDIHITGIHVTDENILLYNQSRLAVYGITADGSFRAVGSFSVHGFMLGLFRQNCILPENKGIRVSSFTGTVKQNILLGEELGCCDVLTVSDPYILVGTNAGMIVVYDLSRREARHVRTIDVSDQAYIGGGFYSIQCNTACTSISFQFKRLRSDVPDCHLFIWDSESEDVHVMDFMSMTTGLHGADEMSPPLSNAAQEVKSLARNRCPLAHFWDKKEPKLLVCECARVVYSPTSGSEGVSPRSAAPDSQVDTAAVVMYFTGEHGFLLQDCMSIEASFTGLLGLCAPYIYFTKKPSAVNDADTGTTGQSVIAKLPLRDFADMDVDAEANEETRRALIDFSFHYTLGNLDEAFSKIRKIQGKDIWTNLAKMCVTRHRLDVATICLGNIGNCSALRAVRLARERHPEPEVHLAALAMELGMNAEAAELYRSCGRYDLLMNYHRAMDDFQEAASVAAQFDPLHQRNNDYRRAKECEMQGNFETACEYFERADTHRSDVPRMLVADPVALEKYITKAHDEKLYSYWGSYLESLNEMDTALQFYEECDDYVNQVRILCFAENYEKAAQMARSCGDKAACYHLARQFETVDMPAEAIEFYSKALAYSSAIRLAKESAMDGDLLALALRSSRDDQVDVGEYFEGIGVHDKAIMLYQKGGAVSRALELSFRTKEYTALENMASELDDNTDPRILRQCANFFLENGQHERAVPMLIGAKEYMDAVELCLKHKIEVTPEMAQKMTLPKSSDPEVMAHRRAILQVIATCCEEQGLFQLACKKFTQAGDHVLALKALLKSGNVETICYYATANRRKDLFVMAGNWLQQQDWRNDPVIMEKIVAMYSKGKALDSLASFYESCAEVEVEEYRNYEKALGALTEAQTHMNKAIQRSTSTGLESQAVFLESRMRLMRKFVLIKQMMKDDPAEGVKECRALLDEADVETGVRIGDIYAAMVDHYAQQGDCQQAYTLMQELRQQAPEVNMAYYISLSIIENVHRTLGIPLGRGRGAEDVDVPDGGAEVGDDDDDIADELGV